MVPLMKRCVRCIPLALLIFFLAPAGVARAQKKSQTSKFTPYWKLNINGGTSLFFGDLKQNKFLPATYKGHTEWRMGAGLMVGRQFSSVFGLRGQALYGQLSGISTSLGRYFQGNYIEFNVTGTLHLNSLISGYNPNRKTDVYLLAGVGMTNYNSISYDLATNSLLGRKGYGYGHGLGGRTLEGDVLGGVGVRYRINKQWSIHLESVTHAVNSDDVDLLVQNSKFDMYNYTSLGISFGFRFKKQPKKLSHKKTSPTGNLNVAAPVHEKKQQKNTSVNQNIPPVSPEKVQKSQTTAVQKTTPPQPKKKVQKPVRQTLPVRPISEYRVQIRARYHHPVSLIYLSNHYHIAQNRIRIDIFNGYYIYTVGSFDTYQQARTERDILRTQNGVTDAFVVFFKNGRRIGKLPSTRIRKNK